jgi:hypothetical protein
MNFSVERTLSLNLIAFVCVRQLLNPVGGPKPTSPKEIIDSQPIYYRHYKFSSQEEEGHLHHHTYQDISSFAFVLAHILSLLASVDFRSKSSSQVIESFNAFSSECLTPCCIETASAWNQSHLQWHLL